LARRQRSLARAATGVGSAGDRIVDVDVSWLVPADLDAVDALARLQVAASRPAPPTPT
jgi:hypothetical protein